MIQAKCIQKFRDKNNNIYGYRLQDKKGQVLDVKPDKLKQAIKNNQITIINLILTSDNRLIDIKSQHQQTEEQKLQKIITKARLLGINNNIQTFCGHTCELISLSDKHIIIIPDDVTKLNESMGKLTFTTHIQQLQDTIKVIGGKNLRDASHMFYGCQAQSLDLSSFNTSNVTDMKYMFIGCQAQSLDLSSFNTSNVTNMNSMFSNCQATSLDISSFNTSNITTMEHMFNGCQATSIDLSSFNTSKVTNMHHMFCRCQATSLDLSSFNTSNVTDMSSMFHECQATSLDLSSFNTSNVTNMRWMFEECKTTSLDLSSFNTSKVKDMYGMFWGCKAQQIKATDTEILKRILI